LVFQIKVHEETQISPNDGSIEVLPRIRLRDGRHLAYIERGVPKDKAKYKIIIVHGFGSTKGMHFQASQVITSVSLSEKNRTCYALCLDISTYHISYNLFSLIILKK